MMSAETEVCVFCLHSHKNKIVICSNVGIALTNNNSLLKLLHNTIHAFYLLGFYCKMMILVI